MHEGLPGDVKMFFVRGVMSSFKAESYSTLAQGAVGSGGYSSRFGIVFLSGKVASFCFSDPPPHEGVVGSL